SLEPHGLLSPKAHLCAYGYTILKNALNYRLSLLHKPIFPFFAERSASNKKAAKLTMAELNSFMCIQQSQKAWQKQS
ncbi:MAG: hypothetical protein NTX06_00885, partial [Proteobacteria bacterium]|nr:hypothetical protein [Pseudomonadota bacterium]